MKALPRVSVALAVLVGCLGLTGLETLPAEGEPAVGESPSAVAARTMLLPAGDQFDLEEKDLKVLWAQELGQAAKGKELKALYAVENLVILETTDANLLYLDAQRGTWRSATSLKGPLSQPPLLGERFLYALSGGKVVAVDVRTGTVKKEVPLRLAESAPPVLYEGTLLLGTGDGKIVRFGLEEGLHIWTRSTEGNVRERPLVSGGIVFAAGNKGSVVALEGGMGLPLWSWRPAEPAEVSSGLALGPEGLYVGDDLGFLYCLDAETGMPICRYPTGRPILSCTLIGPGKVFVCTYKGKALCIGLGDEPEVLWTYPDVERLVTLGRDVAYCLTRDGRLCAISTESGQELWRLEIPSDWQVVAGAEAGTFLLFNRAGSVLAAKERD